jgi:hypothetical protein
MQTMNYVNVHWMRKHALLTLLDSSRLYSRDDNNFEIIEDAKQLNKMTKLESVWMCDTK